MTKSVKRLFEQFQPSQYGVAFNIDPEALTFSGTVMIRGKKIGRPSERLTFHQKNLKITAATITKHDKKGDQFHEISRINNQDSLDEVRLHSASSLYAGDYTVTMDFEGTITKHMNGIYPSYFTHDGQEKRLIATQFESHYARQAFPCIDEPEAKATFDLTLVTPEVKTVLGNTPVKSQDHRDGLLITSFETTPRMSTYLLAFVFGELDYTEAVAASGVVVRSYATPDQVKLTRHGLDIAVRGLEFFNDYFGVPYPLPKLDMVALPDFEAGAMENWGLMTFREVTLLYDDDSGSIDNKQYVALVVSHELSHQWFGDLVTMQWWNDLWLNESFANMMEYRVMDSLEPSWNIWEQFVASESVSAKRRDSLADVQAIKTDVHHPDEISTIFDPSIVYAKGGTVLHMLLNYIGEDAFRAGLQTYFKQHAYGNTVAADLWEALTASSGQDIGAFMHDWLNRPGFPLVTVDYQPGTETVALHQQRFLTNPGANTSESQPWQVPLAANVELADPLLTGSSATNSIVEPSDTPLLLNHNGNSYLVAQYLNADHRSAISDGLTAGNVSVIDRQILLDNYLMLQRAGIAKLTELLDLLPAFGSERSETVWGSLAMAIGEVRRLIEGDAAAEAQLDALVQPLVADLVAELGWEDQPADSPHDLQLRGTIYSIAAGSKLQTVVDEGLQRFANFHQLAELPASTRSVVLFCGARFGTEADFQKLLMMHAATLVADEKEELAGALTSVKQPAQYENLFELLTNGQVRRQDMMHWFVYLLRNRYSRTAAWDWLVNHWSWIEQEFSSDKSYDGFPRYAGSIFSRADELERYTAFFADKAHITSLARNIKLGTQELTSRVDWRNRNEADVKTWLAQQ